MSQMIHVSVAQFLPGLAGSAEGERSLLREAPLVMRVNRQTEYSVMRTPGHDRDLTVGFLFTEGIIRGVGDILLLSECPDNPDVMDVTVTQAPAAESKRTTSVNSSCGLCGRTDIKALVSALKPAGAGCRVSVSLLYELPDRVRKAQSLFRETGASHAAALFSASGDLILVREDVGRHNAMDKVIGQSLLCGRDLACTGVYLSGRTSLEMIVKAARAGIGLIIAVSAPTDAAVRASEALNITLCGFVRGSEATVYSHQERITEALHAS